MVEGDIGVIATKETAMQASNFLSNPQALADAAAAGFNQALFNFVAMLPNLIAAVVLVIFGWFVGKLIAEIIRKLLQFVRLEEFLAAHNVDDALGNVKVSKVLVQLTKYYVILIFFQAAVALLALGPISDFLTKVVDFAPKAIGAILVVVAAAIIGELVREKVLEVHEKDDHMRLIANGSKYLLVFLGLIVGLDTIGFPTTILTTTFVTLIQVIGFAFALAFGLAFGFGGQEAAKDWIKEWRKRLHL